MTRVLLRGDVTATPYKHRLYLVAAHPSPKYYARQEDETLLVAVRVAGFGQLRHNVEPECLLASWEEITQTHLMVTGRDYHTTFNISMSSTCLKQVFFPPHFI